MKPPFSSTPLLGVRALLQPKQVSRDRPAGRPCLLAILLLACAFGGGCRATNHVVQLSQPHTKPIAHRVQTLDVAYESTDGRLWLQASGRLAGAAKPAPLTVVLPPPHVQAAKPVAQRITLPTDAVRPGWEPVGSSAAKGRPIPIGPPLTFTGSNTYEWHRLLPSTGNGRELRLVRRPGTVGEWEVLHVALDPVTQECAFTVFEVRPQQTQFRHRAALALVPLAMASDVVAVTAMVSGPIIFVGMGGAGAVLHGRPDLAATVVDTAVQSEPVKQLRGR